NIRPGDSVTFKITGKDVDQKLTFFGKEEATRYNFDVLVSEEIDKERLIRGDNLVAYRKQLDSWKNSSTKSLTTYLSEYKVEKSINAAGINRINYHYVKTLYVKAYYSPPGIIPTEYFEGLDKYPFRDDKLLNIDEYRAALYFKYILTTAHDNAQPIKIAHQKIQSELKGKTKDFSLSLLAGEYSQKGTLADSTMLRQIFQGLRQKKLDSNYLTYLKNSEVRYFNVGRPFSNIVLEKTFLIHYATGKSFNLSELLKSYKSKAVYFDLWASWCGPCREDIKVSSEVKAFLAAQNVSVVYLSIDKNESAWKKASEEDRITENQFCFKNETQNYLSAFISLEGIPRYILLDKDHNVVTLDAPRPYSSNKKQFEDLIQTINSGK
ncbi:MAG: redoxin domain-containing protein, partial [Flavobacterium sp.]